MVDRNTQLERMVSSFSGTTTFIRPESMNNDRFAVITPWYQDRWRTRLLVWVAADDDDVESGYWDLCREAYSRQSERAQRVAGMLSQADQPDQAIAQIGVRFECSDPAFPIDLDDYPGRPDSLLVSTDNDGNMTIWTD